jgi:2'-5' RNA ligase
MKLSCIALLAQSDEKTIQAFMDEYSQETDSKKALAWPPHFSLWGDFEIDEAALYKLSSGLNDLTANNLPLTVTASEYGFYPWRIIYLDIQKTDQLQSLHESVMNTIISHRTSWIPQALVDSTHFEGKQRDYIERFGYHFAKEFYSPHFTLAGNDMTEEKFQYLVSKLKGKHEDITVKIVKIALVELGESSKKIIWTSGG